MTRYLLYKDTFNIVFKHIKDTFPFESKRIFNDFIKLFELKKRELKTIQSDREFFLFLETTIALLHNSHTKLGKHPFKKFYAPLGYKVFLIDKKFYLLKEKKIIGEIVLIDNVLPKRLLIEKSKRISAGGKYYLYNQATKFLLLDTEKKPVEIFVKNNDKKRLLILRRTDIKQTSLPFPIKARILKDNIGYLKILSWIGRDVSNLFIDKQMTIFRNKNIRSIIIDVRGNNGGDSYIAKRLVSYFFSSTVVFGIIKSRKTNKVGVWHNYSLLVDPGPFYLNIPIVILVDKEGFSSNEYFIAGMKDNKRAYIIGECTGGGSGNPKKFVIPFGKDSFELFISTWIYFRPNKSPLEGIGIRPHLTITQTQKDLSKNKDRFLETGVKKAQELFKNKTQERNLLQNQKDEI